MAYDHYDDTGDYTVRDNRGWMTLLMIPLLFAVGWFANDALADNQTNVGNQAEVGIGGGPGEVTPCPVQDDSDV